jgi:hypothetical protein
VNSIIKNGEGGSKTTDGTKRIIKIKNGYNRVYMSSLRPPMPGSCENCNVQLLMMSIDKKNHGQPFY